MRLRYAGLYTPGRGLRDGRPWWFHHVTDDGDSTGEIVLLRWVKARQARSLGPRSAGGTAVIFLPTPAATGGSSSSWLNGMPPIDTTGNWVSEGGSGTAPVGLTVHLEKVHPEVAVKRFADVTDSHRNAAACRCVLSKFTQFSRPTVPSSRVCGNELTYAECALPAIEGVGADAWSLAGRVPPWCAPYLLAMAADAELSTDEMKLIRKLPIFEIAASTEDAMAGFVALDGGARTQPWYTRPQFSAKVEGVELTEIFLHEPTESHKKALYKKLEVAPLPKKIFFLDHVIVQFPRLTSSQQASVLSNLRAECADTGMDVKPPFLEQLRNKALFHRLGGSDDLVRACDLLDPRIPLFATFYPSSLPAREHWEYLDFLESLGLVGASGIVARLAACARCVERSPDTEKPPDDGAEVALFAPLTIPSVSRHISLQPRVERDDPV